MGGQDVIRVGSAGLVARLKLRDMQLREGRVEVSCLSATITKKTNTIVAQIQLIIEFKLVN